MVPGARPWLAPDREPSRAPQWNSRSDESLSIQGVRLMEASRRIRIDAR